ncbi:MAG: tetratricopeptide repeat protein [Kiritimatiellia bacterium]
MSEKQKENAVEKDVGKIKPIPENLPEELLPLYDWWKEKGFTTLITAVTVILLAVGIFGYRQFRISKITEANIGLTQASGMEELEELVAKYGKFKAGNSARIRLAKAYYDASKYEDALAVYRDCEKAGVPQGFEDIVTLGKAHSLEAVEKTDEALAIFKNFVETKKDSYLYPHAVMGFARALTLQGKKDEAGIILEELKAEKTGDTAWEMIIADTEDLIEGYEPRAGRSLFDMADEAGKKMEKEAEKAEPEAGTE